MIYERKDNDSFKSKRDPEIQTELRHSKLV